LLADTATMKCAAVAGRQENSKQVHLMNFLSVPLERRNKQYSLESEICLFMYGLPNDAINS
jgi:hypothetical protein